nr:hypothetical protein Iba_chr09bCG3360 [Ipomoea batatas]
MKMKTAAAEEDKPPWMTGTEEIEIEIEQSFCVQDFSSSSEAYSTWNHLPKLASIADRLFQNPFAPSPPPPSTFNRPPAQPFSTEIQVNERRLSQQNNRDGLPNRRRRNNSKQICKIQSGK